MNNSKPDFKGIWSPAELIFSSLSLYEERLLAIIWALDNIHTMGCKAGNAYLGKMMKLKSKNQKYSGVSNLIKKLIDKGHIHRTLIYKLNTQEVESRHLKVISPLLVTEQRRIEDRFLATLIILDDDPPSSEMMTPIIENDDPIIQDEIDSTVDNREVNNEELSKKRESENSKSTEEVDIVELNDIWIELALSNKAYMERWLAKYSKDQIQKMAESAAATFFKNYLKNTHSEKHALVELDRRLRKSNGTEPSIYLHSWIQKEPSFKRPQQQRKNGKPEFKDYQDRADQSAELARQYAERNRRRAGSA